MLSLIYQPMTGAFGCILSAALSWNADGRSGYSSFEPQRRLFLALGLEMNERGPGVCLSNRLPSWRLSVCCKHRGLACRTMRMLYMNTSIEPLSPGEFFRNMHLMMLLRDRVGKYAVISLRESFGATNRTSWQARN